MHYITHYVMRDLPYYDSVPQKSAVTGLCMAATMIVSAVIREYMEYFVPHDRMV